MAEADIVVDEVYETKMIHPQYLEPRIAAATRDAHRDAVAERVRARRGLHGMKATLASTLLMLLAAGCATFGPGVAPGDSEAQLRAAMGRAGAVAFDAVQSAISRNADVVLINTCSVRERAEEKLFTRLGELKQMAVEEGQRPIVAVAGCVAQQEGEQILKRSTAVDVIIGTQNLKRLPMLVDQGTADSFISTQLMPERLEKAAADAGCPLTLRRQVGYDHSYYFVASFIEDHLRHHHARLRD